MHQGFPHLLGKFGEVEVQVEIHIPEKPERLSQDLLVEVLVHVFEFLLRKQLRLLKQPQIHLAKSLWK